MDSNKAKALSAALGQIEKQFGKGAVMRLGDAERVQNIDTVDACDDLDGAALQTRALCLGSFDDETSKHIRR